MRQAARLMFWGLLLWGFDFSLNGLNLLPDWLGYLLQAKGCRRADSQSAAFGKAHQFSLALAALWVVQWLTVAPIAELAEYAMRVLECVAVWWLLTGVAEAYGRADRPDLASLCLKARVPYVALRGTLLLAHFAKNQGAISFVPLFVIVVAMVAMHCVTMYLVWQARQIPS